MTLSIFNEFIFDQYSRYKACADLIGQTDFASGSSILDVGSGPECQFGRFMPDALITFLDPLISESPDERKIKGDIFSDRLDGRTFDYVTAVDVLEHVPPEFRVSFLNRIAALSKGYLIIGFPTLESGDALAVDQEVEDRYRAIFNTEYSWLKEHHEFGLPSIDSTIDLLEKDGWTCQTIGHGHTPWLKDLLSLVICAWECNELKNIVLEVSQKFNKTLYPSDFKAPHYRKFIIAARKPLPVIYPPVSILSESESDSKFLELLAEAKAKILEVSFQKFRERDNTVAERDSAVAERDSAAAERNRALTERDTAVALVNAMRQSASWRITRPLRFIARFARYGLTAQDRQSILRSLRYRYHRLPLPTPVKSLIRFAYHKVYRKGIRLLRSSHIRDAHFHMPEVKPTAKHKDKPDYVIWGVVDWHFRHQRPQQLALALVATGRRVFYVSPTLVDDKRNGFDVEKLDSSANLFQIKLYGNGAPSIYNGAPSSIIIGQLKLSIGEVLNWAGCDQIVSLLDHPFWLDVATALPNSRLIYDCMDHHEGFGNNADSTLQLERRLFKEAELTITTSGWLYDAIAPLAKRQVLIRNGGDYQHFSNVLDSYYRDSQGRRVIGYYGAIAEWFDLDLVEAVARKYSECAVLLIGADTVNARSRLGKVPNVTFTGEVPYQQLPFYLCGFDICLLPFKVVPLTMATNPVKVYEYLSAGKPTIAVDLPEMAQFNELVYTAKNKGDFLATIGNVLSQKEPISLGQQRKSFAEGQTWQHRTATLIQAAESTELEPKVSIVVVTYNNLDFTRACLESLDAHSQYEQKEVIVVDNASRDGTQAFLLEWVGHNPNRRLILNEDNRGFAAANNQGLAIAAGEFLVLLNNDTYVTPGWIRTLVHHLDRDKTLGLIGPVTNNIGNEAKIEISYVDMGEMLMKSAAYTHRHIGQTYPLRTAAFFCVMMSRTTYASVGPLDETFGRGFFEDDDYCRRIEKVGLRVACAEDVFVHHHLSASFNKLKSQDRQKLFDDNKIVYEAKWGPWVPHGLRSQSTKQLTTRSNIESLPEVFDGHQYINGQCNVCGKASRFFYKEVSLWRESLNCEHCRSTSRYRSIARGLLLAVAELVGAQAASLATLPRSSKRKLRVYDTQPPFYYEPCAYPLPDQLKATGWIDLELSNYKPNKPMGVVLAKGITNQNLECLTYADESLDIVITSDVMEHVRLDDRAHKEIYRVLKLGGVYLFTVPHDPSWEKTLTRVQVVDSGDQSKDVQLLEPEYHGDTNSDGGGGVLAYRTYGRDLVKYLSELGFDVQYAKEDFPEIGIMNTELFYCRKPT